jgi:protein-tyrosine phosphatase
MPTPSDTAPTPDERILPFRGIANFRDYGGYRTADGRLRRSMLFRSAQHRDAAADDLATVAALHLSGVVDLRGADERAVAPCPRPPGFDARLFVVEERTGGLLGPHLADAHAQPGGFDARWLMRTGYAAMPFRWRLRNTLRNYFEALELCEGATLVHCAAGKDRTGLAVALLHTALGVHRDDVMADYLLTDAARPLDAGFAASFEGTRRLFGEHLEDAQIRALMTTEPEYLEAALDSIDDRYGNVVRYLELHLDVSRRSLARIAQRLTE